MKTLAKSLLRTLLPAAIFARLSAISARRFIQEIERRRGLDKLNRDYVAKYGRRVLQGPFKGMEYSPMTDGRHVGARLAGCYELELNDAVERCCNTPYASVIDVGCAEGYYAVGFARRIPGAEVTAFDTDPWARRACGTIAEANGVSARIHLDGYCSPAGLRSAIGAGRTLIVLDCEGYEAVLLDPHSIPELARCDLIVELHDAPPAPDHPLVAKFRESHEIELITGRPRTGAEVEMLRDLPPSERLRLIDELRQPWQGWAVLWAK